MQVRLALSVVEHGQATDLNVKLMVARRPEEPMSHVVMRVLAYCLFYRSDLSQPLQFARGPADRDCPDLWSHDLAGRPVEWIICGRPDVDELRHLMKHQRQAQVRVLFVSPEEQAAFFEEVRGLRQRLPGLDSVDCRALSLELVERLAASHLERQRWAVTVVEEHLYVDADGVAADAEVVRSRYVEENGGR